MMTEYSVLELAMDLFEWHGMPMDWRFDLDRAHRRLGRCSHRKKLITLSVHFIKAKKTTQEDITDTILHEIAHALVGGQHGHNDVWKRKCIEIGAKPERCGQAFSEVSRYVGVCPKCGHQSRFYRKVRRYYVCVKCPDKPRITIKERRDAEVSR